MYRLVFVVCLAFFSTSCSEPSHIPKDEDARKALAIGLDAWKAGKTSGTVSDSGPRIVVIDTQWSSGQPLDSYEITGEESSGSSKIFNVGLVIGKPPKSVETKYHVLGSEDMMIYRDEDFTRAMNMDNALKSKPSGKNR